MEKQICLFCNIEFEVKYIGQKYCSKKCNNKSQENKIEINCKYCNKIIKVKKSLQNKIYCNKKCYLADKLIIKKCLLCNNEFTVKKHKSSRKFCSLKCAKVYSKKLKEINCLQCNKVILPTTSLQKFCSHKCGNLYKVEKQSIKCDHCGKQYLKIPSNIFNRNFCNKKCRTEFQNSHPETMHSYIDGRARLNCKYPIEFSRQLRNKIRKDYNNECVVCKSHPIDKALSIHHIDYDKKNNSLTNLVPICTNHHMKTNFNREYWKQYFDVMFTGGIN